MNDSAPANDSPMEPSPPKGSPAGQDLNQRKIVAKLNVDRGSLRRLNPVSSGPSSIVYLTKRGSYEVGTSRLTMGELWLRTPKEVYSVDTAPHQTVFTLELPSQEEAFSFSAEVRTAWHVSDPVAAVASDLADPLPFLRGYVEERLREITRQFDVESSAAAERRINLDYGDRAVMISNAIEMNRCTVVLSLEEGTRDHIAGRTLAEREREKLRASEVTEAQAHVLELQRAQYQQQLAAAKEKHELELKEQRMKVYADALRTDDLNVLALLLAGHGDDVKDVINLMMQQKQMKFEGANAMLNSLLEANLLNRKDVAAIMANASNVVIDNLRGANATGAAKVDAILSRPPLPVDAVRSDRDELDSDGDME